MSRRPRQDEDVEPLRARLLPAPGASARVAPVAPPQLRPLARLVATIAGRITGTGPPNLFTTLGQHPRLFRPWLRYSVQLMPLGRLARRDTELVILRVAWQCGCAYEWHQHVPLALRSGLTAGQIEAVAGAPANGLSPHQRTLLTACDELLTLRALTDDTWTAVQAALGDREAIELCLLIGNYQGLATTIGALGIQVEPGG